MIFVTVGTHPQQFDRLFVEMDRLLKQGKVNDRVFGQIGNCNYIPNMPYKRLLNEEEYKKIIKKADIVISHGGAGSIINSLSYKKSLIIAPRQKRFNEHTNDHQIELARKIESKGLCLVVEDINDLQQTIEKIKKGSRTSFQSEKRGIVKSIKGFLDSYEISKS